LEGFLGSWCPERSHQHINKAKYDFAAAGVKMKMKVDTCDGYCWVDY
jgi:hypothetical protein